MEMPNHREEHPPKQSTGIQGDKVISRCARANFHWHMVFERNDFSRLVLYHVLVMSSSCRRNRTIR